MVVVILLRFGENKHLAKDHMRGHNEWIQAGVDDGVFLLVGSIAGGQGGAILAHGVTRDQIQQRVQSDPLVEHGIAVPEIILIEPAILDKRLALLRG